MMGKKRETQSNWECVSNLIENEKPIVFGQRTSNWYLEQPREMLVSLNFYKFAAKMIGENKRVLNLDCHEGLGSWVLAQECGYCKGIDRDGKAIANAQHNFSDPCIEFATTQKEKEQWDAVVHFDSKEVETHDWKKTIAWLTDQGIALLRVQSASEKVKTYFGQVFLFSMLGEIIYPGELKAADHILILACQPKGKSL